MQGVKAFEADFRNSDLRLANFGGAYLEGAAIPPLERLATPGEIDAQPSRSLRENVAERRKGNQEGNAGNIQEGQDRSRSPSGEQRDKGRGRGR